MTRRIEVEICDYCGYRARRRPYSPWESKDTYCPKCQSKVRFETKLDDSDPFGYYKGKKDDVRYD